ncbi:endonuclease/exonuclease/phosphatase family protein [Streptomyces sp. NPDC048290]|uniref:endonuclease/exonuclease/phosphatase family protein n=1 Tax=Streptomyces sp. NPDC048290 TaxID=3155811 RepID=UPI0034172F6C
MVRRLRAAASTDGGAGPWRRGRVTAVAALLTAALLICHRVVPNTALRLGSLLESFLPWLALPMAALLGVALLRRSALALLALLLPVAGWTYVYGGLLLPEPEAAPGDLVVVQHNVSDENADPAGTARVLAAADPDLIALEELTPPALEVYRRALAPEFPHHAVRGTVGLWSRHPLTGVRAVDIAPEGITRPWSRGLRSLVGTPHGRFAVYVAHLPSVRVGPGGLASAWRDESARLLGDALAAEEERAVVLLGDLNGTVDDRGLSPLTSALNVPERGFAFSFPASFPVARIDQVMARAATVPHIGTLPSTGSDHLPVVAHIRPAPGTTAP